MEFYNEDCITLMKGMGDDSVTMTLTDIPYDVVNNYECGIREYNKGNADILTLRNLFSKYYNKNNVFFVNANDVEIFLKIGECYIKSCNTEINNNWSEGAIWKKNIEDIIDPEKQKKAKEVSEDYKIEKPIKKNPRKMLFNL